MKEWALSKGVTHYTHWFQPLTGATAEKKHDAFFETSYDGSDPVEKFGGAQLVQQEPDAKFLMEELEIHLKQRIYHGINISCIYMVPLCIPTVLFRIPEKHWIIKFRC
jgi:glutamine synthetase